MPSRQTIVLFMISAFGLNLTPGPAILFILSRCLGQGQGAAAVSVFGLATASVIQAVAAASGLSALFAYSTGRGRAPLTGNPTFFRGGAARAAFSGTDRL